ncbi:MAG: MvdD family ATP-grasp ribosomal peptide maturase [Alphaproteobacteria bacterium]|nr:MvdD family ATP-grasp ribosomal peptide maturase [Alphaproteobacteria bacterium]MCB9758198.1 MvdD family ATP-grasp ribosomal peptide maturase [Alphaproteobacteria bacterium]MCB9795105.1 MvdD family ATP-grasp ribosomal peptide maturase [Alphaproteobacteria bacterium]
MQVLIVTTRSTPTERVEQHLRALGHVPVRLETDRFPAELRLSLLPEGHIQLRDGETRVVLDSLEAIWYRRALYRHDLPPEADLNLRRGVVEEVRSFIQGLMASQDAFLLQPKWSIDHTDAKPRQLSLARACGLDVPATLAGNEAEAARAFGRENGDQIVTKLFTGFAVAQEGAQKVMFTTALGPEEIAEIDGLDLCPAAFQERLEKVKEYRVTLVGDEVFACSVDSAQAVEGEVDWRRAQGELAASWRRDTLPEDAARGLKRLCHRLELSYGAADFILTPEGRCVFLEVNPAGEYLWMDQVWEGAISEALAEVLVGLRPRRPADGP